MLRPSLSGDDGPRERLHPGPVSPELMLRPSLSGHRQRHRRRRGGRVAGAYAPAFVERRHRRSLRQPRQHVSPELMLRPSLSEPASATSVPAPLSVSPELMLRPSLSARARRWLICLSTSVAGAYAPAFVERASVFIREVGSNPSVAGAYAPAFVERGCGSDSRFAQPARCRRSLCSGLR